MYKYITVNAAFKINEADECFQLFISPDFKK